MGRKKVMVLLLAIIMQVSLLPGGICRAAEVIPLDNPAASSAVSLNESSLISQDRAIQIFCAAFPDITRDKDLIAEYQEQGYYQTGWQISDREKGPRPYAQQVISGFVDAKSGEILRLDYNPESEFYLGKKVILTREQAKETAQQFLVKIQPDKARDLKLNTDNTLNILPNRNIQLYYNFTWQRQINGLPFDWDNISIGVDAYTGMVTHYNCNWNQVELPVVGQLLPREELQKKLANNIGLVANYRNDYDKYGQSTGKIIPVYRLNIISSYVDARSGSFLDPYGRVLSNKDLKLYDKGDAPLTNTIAINEAPWPTKQIDPEIAKKAARDFFSNMGYEGEVRHSGGGSSSTGSGYREEHWSYRLQDAGADSELEVNVNAYTGEVIGFNINGITNGSANLNYEQALIKARAAVQKYDPDKVNQITLSHNMYGDDNSSDYHYQFTRLLNGVPFSRDYIMVTVNGKSGEVVRYDRGWRPVQCDALPELISPQEAMAKIWSQNALTLSYILPRDNQYKPAKESIPVYRLPYTEINACTGEPMIRMPENSEILMPQGTWSGHWAAPALSLLESNGLINRKTTDAETPMNRRDVLKVLVTATNPRISYGDEYNYELKLTDIAANDADQSIFKMAINRGMITNQGKFEPEKSINREELAVWLIKSLGFESVAAIKSRIVTPVIDAKEISPDKTNYVGLVYGLGLMTSDQSGCFKPNKSVTWAEMATIMTRLAPLSMQVYEHQWMR